MFIGEWRGSWCGAAVLLIPREFVRVATLPLCSCSLFCFPVGLFALAYQSLPCDPLFFHGVLDQFHLEHMVYWYGFLLHARQRGKSIRTAVSICSHGQKAPSCDPSSFFVLLPCRGLCLSFRFVPCVFQGESRRMGCFPRWTTTLPHGHEGVGAQRRQAVVRSRRPAPRAIPRHKSQRHVSAHLNIQNSFKKC